MKSLYQKYRPQAFSEVVGQEKIVQTLVNALSSDKVGHAYLFAGQRGTGKTTFARIMAKTINCISPKDGQPCLKCEQCKMSESGQAVDIIEIDAASNRGIDDIRDLRDKIRFAPTLSKYKVYIIDEVHMLSKDAFNALLKTLEEPPAHVIFIMATTEAHKLPATILSRVQRFDFGRISGADIIKNLQTIVKAEKIDIDDAALALIASKADGSHRDAISLLEQIKSYATKISIKEAEEVLGVADIQLSLDLLEEMRAGNREAAFRGIADYFNQGYDLVQLSLGLAEALREAILFRSKTTDLLILTPEKEKTFEQLADLPISSLVAALEAFLQSAKEGKSSSIPSLPLEVAVTKVIEEWGPSQISNIKPSFAQGYGRAQQEPKSEEPKPEIAKTEIKLQEVTSDSKELDDAVWKEILEKIKSHNHSLNALLRDIKPAGKNGGKLILCAKFKFHKDKVSEAKNRQIIEQVIEEVTGEKLSIFCELFDKLPKQKQELSEDELLKTAEEVFS